MSKIKDYSFLEDLRPVYLNKFLKENIKGQDNAIHNFSLSIYNHFKRLDLMDKYSNKFHKNNIFLIGDTGTGKTMLVKELKENFQIPVFITSATEYTAEGYHGKSVSDMIKDFYAEVKSKVLIENSIIFIDEIDKISINNNANVDVGGKEVQNSLLKLIEGTDIIFKYEEQRISINTENILFICAGAFDGINKIIEKRNVNSSIGLIREKKEKQSDKILIEDIAKFGFKKEFIGRFNTVIELNKHTKETLTDILVNSVDSPLTELYLRFKEENCILSLTKYAIEHIAELAIKNSTGARSLNKVIYDLFYESLSECIDNSYYEKKINVYKEDIKNNKIKVIYVDDI